MSLLTKLTAGLALGASAANFAIIYARYAREEREEQEILANYDRYAEINRENIDSCIKQFDKEADAKTTHISACDVTLALFTAVAIAGDITNHKIMDREPYKQTFATITAISKKRDSQ